jgi:hypothetical protein
LTSGFLPANCENARVSKSNPVSYRNLSVNPLSRAGAELMKMKRRDQRKWISILLSFFFLSFFFLVSANVQAAVSPGTTEKTPAGDSGEAAALPPAAGNDTTPKGSTEESTDPGDEKSARPEGTMSMMMSGGVEGVEQAFPCHPFRSRSSQGQRLGGFRS